MLQYFLVAKSSVLQPAFASRQACHLALFLSAHLLRRCYINLLSPQRISRHFLLSLFLMSTFLLSGKWWQARVHYQANIVWGRLTPAEPSGSSLPASPVPLVSPRQETLHPGQTRNGLGFLACFKAKASLGSRLTVVHFGGGIKSRKVALIPHDKQWCVHL